MKTLAPVYRVTQCIGVVGAGYEVARQFLSQTNTSVGTIADTLGYADASPFIRAFRRWSATTPAQWRARNATADT